MGIFAFCKVAEDQLGRSGKQSCHSLKQEHGKWIPVSGSGSTDLKALRADS